MEEESLRRMLMEEKNKQRKQEISMRNQEVRMINASKIVNNDSINNERRSQSCIEYSNKKGAQGKSSSGERTRHHSHENKTQRVAPTVAPNPIKQIPKTTTNQTKIPRSFVNEIKQLTY